MANLNDLYPASPQGLPVDIARPTLGYRLQVVGVLASLILFVALYLTLIGASAYWVYWSLTALPNSRGMRDARSSGPPYLVLISIAAGTLLCLFLVKSLFKRSRFD